MKSLNAFLIGLATIALMPFAQAQNGAGNGGDPLRNTFEQAQVAAAQMASQVLPCSFRPEVAPSVRDWIIKNQAAYVQDLRTTQLKWIVDLQGTCAYTALTSASNIYLSYNECRDTTHSLEDAMFTVLHETVHHFNVTDESFGDAVARAILYGTYPMNSCPSAGTPFDPEYCQGSLMSTNDAIARFSPGTTAVELNHSLNWTIRMRTCQKLTGCNQWSNGGASLKWLNPSTGSFDTEVGTVSSGLDIQSGEIHLKIVFGSHPYNSSVSDIIYNLQPSKVIHADAYPYMRTDDNRDYGVTYNGFVQGKVTNQCLWLKHKYSFDYGNDVSHEFEVVYYGNH